MSIKDDMERVPLGSSLFYTKIVDQEERWVGVILWYDECKIHEDCRGTVPFSNFPDDRAKWQVVSQDPLTLSPSILRKPCDLHGWIQNGEWVWA